MFTEEALVGGELLSVWATLIQTQLRVRLLFSVMIALGWESPNQESKLRYISIWEGALPLWGAVAPVINKTPIYSPCSPTTDIQTALANRPVIMARIWTVNINHTIGNAMIRDAKLKQMQRVTLSALRASYQIIFSKKWNKTEPLALIQICIPLWT